MNDSQKIEVLHSCARCGTRRSEKQMTKVGAVWACNVGGGTSCAMQLIYRGYGNE
jgi:hypothetical protein